MGNRRSFLSKTLLAIAGGFISDNLIAEQKNNQNTIPSLKEKKVLFTYGGWDGHEPEKFRDYMVPWLRAEGAEVFVFDSPDNTNQNHVIYFRSTRERSFKSH